MTALITRDYAGMALSFQDDGWFNATQAASKHGKEPIAWLRQRDTAEYVSALADAAGKSGFLTEFNQIKDLEGESSASRTKIFGLVKRTGLVKTKAGAPEHGGGTWLHPKLAVHFARWLDPKFAVWCDAQIDNLLRGKDDWRKLRHQSASSFKVANDILKMVRQEQGKDTESHHYSNEARLVNWALAGEFKGLDRDAMSADDLALLAHLEERNAVLIGRGIAYDQRKPMLKQYAMDWRMSRLPAFVAKVEA